MIYGHDKTIHRTTALDVETYKGKVVSVWFRCMALPFQQDEATEERANQMERMSKEINEKEEIHAIDIKRREVVYLLEKRKDCSSNWYFTDLGSSGLAIHVNNARQFNSKEAAEQQRKRFGLDDTWRVVEHIFIKE